MNKVERIRVLRILNRNCVGGPVLNAIFLNKFMDPRFETRLICGNITAGESSANHLFEKYGVDFEIVPGMERSINPLADYKVYKSICQLVDDYRPHIVHTHAAKAGAIGRLAASACKTPVILHTFHGHVFHSYFNPIVTQGFIQAERYLARKSSRIIAISDSQKAELATDFRICDASKITVIPNGIDLDKFRDVPADYRQKWRALFQIADDEIAIGIVGRLAAVKNHPLFVKMAALIREKAPELKVKFMIVGDGPDQAKVIDALQQSNLTFNYYPENQECAGKDVTLTSWQTEMERVYAGLDIVALTSMNEGTPISLMESSAAALPAVSTDVGGVKDVLVKDVTGFLTGQNEEQLADAILKLLRDPRLRYRIGAEAQAYVLRKYSYQRLVKDMEGLYTQLLAEQNILMSEFHY